MSEEVLESRVDLVTQCLDDLEDQAQDVLRVDGHRFSPNYFLRRQVVVEPGLLFEVSEEERVGIFSQDVSLQEGFEQGYNAEEARVGFKEREEE